MLLLSVALAARVLYIALAAPSAWGPNPLAYDGDGYLNHAAAFHSGDFLFSHADVRRMPLYPALIAFWTRLPAPEKWVLPIWHAALDTCALACAYLWVRRAFGEKSALAAAVLYAIYPMSIYRIPLMNTEVIASTALAMFVLGATRVWETGRCRDAAGLSLLTMVLLFINPAFMLFPPLLAFSFFFLLPLKPALRVGSAFLIPVVLISLAWGVRNYAVTGDFYLFDTRGGKEFWLGNNQRVEGRWEGPKRNVWEEELSELYRSMDREQASVSERNRRLYKKGVEEILENPSGATVLFIKKFFRFWYVPASETHLGVTIPAQTGYLLLAVAGMFWGFPRNRRILLPMGVVAYYCAIYSLSYACIRFSQPIMPWVCALGGVGVAEGYHRLRRGKQNHE